MNCVRWSMGDASLHGMSTSWVPGQCFGCYPCPWTKLLPMCPDRTAVALLWWHSRLDHGAARTPKQLVDEIVDVGYPQQNVTRLTKSLEADSRTSKAADGGFRIRISARSDLDAKYEALT